MKLKNEKSGTIVEVVPHEEALSQGYALGLGEEIYETGYTVKKSDGTYSFLTFAAMERYGWKEVTA